MKHKVQESLEQANVWRRDYYNEHGLYLLDMKHHYELGKEMGDHIQNIQETLDNTLTPFEVGYIMGLITMDGNMPNYSWFTKIIEKLEYQKNSWGE